MNSLFIQRPWVKARQQSHASRSHDPLYQTTAWKRDSSLHLMANPLCVECKKEGRAEPSRVSDHVTPINQGGDVWDWKNRQALCNSHHNKKSAKERWTQ